VGNLLWALGCKFTEPINELSLSFRITATLLNEAVQPITTIAPALIASDQWTNSAQKKAPAPHKAN
jgi:hypothetical protein